MATEYSRALLRVALAQICQSLGWQAVQSTPMELLTCILERYLLEIAKTAHRYANQFGRTEPNLDDLGLTFQDLNVHLEDLSEYVQNVDPLPFVAEVPKFPIPKESLLVFPKPDSREVREREEHIDDYLPPMHPEWEEVQSSEPEDCTPSPEDPGDDDSSVVDVDVLSIVPPGAGAEAHDPSATPHNGKKRPHTSPETEQSPDKRARYLPDMAAPHCYKMMSVVMSHSGVLTPTLGIGRLPNARTPPRPPPSPPPKFTHKSQFWPASAKTSDKGQGKVKIKSVKPTVLNPIKKSFKLPKDSDNSKNKDLKRDKSKSKKISSKSKSKKSTKENTSSTALSMLEPKIYKKKKKSQDKKMKGSENSSSGKLKLLLTTRTSKSIGDAPNKNTLEHTPPRKNPLAMASSLALAASGLTTPVSPARSTSSALMNMRTPSPQKIKPISVTTPGSPLIMVDDSDDSDAACPSTPILVEAEEMSMERRTRLDSYTATIEEVVNYSQGIGEEVSISETMEEGEVNHSEIIEEGVNFSETIEEEVNILDTIEEEDNMPGTIEEEVNFSETIEEEEIDILNTIEEEDNFSETVEEEVNLSETIEEEVNFQETMEEEVNFSETVDQEVDISETIEEEVNNSETISEEITISETIEEEVIFSEAIEEEVNICETIEEEVNFSETIEEEVISYSDTVEAVVDSDNIEDVLKVSETAEVLDVLDTVEEVVSYPETIEEVVTYSETVEEVVSYSDTAEEVVSYSENVEDVREEVVAHTEDAEQENVRDSEGEERRKENERLEQELHAEFKTEAEVDKERLQQKFDNAIDGDVGQQVIKPTDSDDRDDGKLTTALGNLKCIPPSPTVSSEQRKVHKMLKTQKSSKLSKGPKGITGMKPLHVQASKNEGGGDAITDSKKDVMKRLKEKIKPKTSDYKSSQGKSVTGLAVTHVKKKPHDGSSSPAITSDRRTSSVQSTQLSIGKVELAEERKLEKETDKEKGKDKEHKKDKKKKKKKDKDKDKSEIIEDKSEKKDKKDKKEKSKKDKKEKKDKKSDKDKECKKDKSTDPVIPRLKFKFGSSGSGSSVIPSVNMFASPQQAVAGSLKVSPHIKTHSSCKAPVSSPQASTVPKLSIKLPSPAKALIPSPILVQSRSRSESRSPSPPYGSRSPRSLHSQYDPQYTFPPHPAPHSKTPISESSLTNPTSPKQSMARTWMASWQTHSPSPPRTPGPFGMPSPMSSTSRSPSPPPQPSRMVSASFLPPPPSSSAKKAAAKMAAAERAAAERMSAERAEAAARLTVEHAAAQKSAKAAAAKILANKSKNSPATGKVKKVSSKKGEPSTPGQSPGALPRQSSAVSPAVPLRQVPAVPIQQPAAALSRQSLPSMSGTTGVISETVGTIIDEHGQTIWICPACKRQDDGSPMIGCDDCDDWFHWVCVGLVVPPPDDKQWYCLQCNTNRLIKNAGKKKKRRKKMK